MNRPVVILGAGATKECGGPLTSEILPTAFEVLGIREDSLSVLSDFLIENFYLPPTTEKIGPQDFPPLPLLLSLVDTAIDRKHAFGKNWPLERLREVRASIEYAIFTVLKKTLNRIPANRDFHHQLFRHLGESDEPTVISLNYDLLVDNAISKLGSERSTNSGVLNVPDYGTEVAHSRGRPSAPFGRLLKIHGSLHWLFCPGCSRLRVNIARTKNYFVKGIWDPGRPCENCGSKLHPVMITPTHLKDYRNPHVTRVWYEAEQALRSADRVIIIGYSLPEDDVEVAYLLKRGLGQLNKRRITVVNHESRRQPKAKNDTWHRYRVLFGTEFKWRPSGFKGWMEECNAKGRNPLTS